MQLQQYEVGGFYDEYFDAAGVARPHVRHLLTSLQNLSDEELTIYTLREAQLILADAGVGSSRDPQDTIQELRDLLNRGDVVEALYRLENGAGLRLA